MQLAQLLSSFMIVSAFCIILSIVIVFTVSAICFAYLKISGGLNTFVRVIKCIRQDDLKKIGL